MELLFTITPIVIATAMPLDILKGGGLTVFTVTNNLTDEVVTNALGDELITLPPS